MLNAVALNFNFENRHPKMCRVKIPDSKRVGEGPIDQSNPSQQNCPKYLFFGLKCLGQNFGQLKKKLGYFLIELSGHTDGDFTVAKYAAHLTLHDPNPLKASPAQMVFRLKRFGRNLATSLASAFEEVSLYCLLQKLETISVEKCVS